MVKRLFDKNLKNKIKINNKVKKGQAEMIGLIIIVIIVISVMLLYIVYKINNPDRSIKHGFVNSELAYNFLTTTTKVSVIDCPQHQLVDLITDCANLQKTIYCNGKLTCEIVNNTMHSLLSQTFEPLGKDFEYNISGTNILLSGACNNKEKVQASLPLTLYPGNEKILVTLDVCDAS